MDTPTAFQQVRLLMAAAVLDRDVWLRSATVAVSVSVLASNEISDANVPSCSSRQASLAKSKKHVAVGLSSTEALLSLKRLCSTLSS